MANVLRPTPAGGWQPYAFLTALAVFFSGLASYALPEKIISVDFICYYTAAQLLVRGESPYDLERQTEIQQALGWDRATTGHALYDCLPYFYPPWFALACTVLLPFGYPAARGIFCFLNLEAALVSGYLLRDTLRPGWQRLPALFVPLFFFSVLCTVLGQTSLFVLLAAIATWKLLDSGCDRAAGIGLACLAFKPQLTAILVLAMLVWAVRQRRWGVAGGFFGTLALLVGVSTLLVPTWPLQMLQAPRLSPPPTDPYPWIGNTWFLVLRALGFEGWPLMLGYLALAVPALAGTARAALDRTGPVADVIALSLLAAFFVAPYGRHYDFPVLAVPALVLAGRYLPRVAGAALLLALVVVPYAQFMLLARLKAAYVPDDPFYLEATFFWVPPLLAALWLVSAASARGKSEPVNQ
jgi:hypothetical protein